jgi:hypothetical protein
MTYDKNKKKYMDLTNTCLDALYGSIEDCYTEETSSERSHDTTSFAEIERRILDFIQNDLRKQILHDTLHVALSCVQEFYPDFRIFWIQSQGQMTKSDNRFTSYTSNYVRLHLCRCVKSVCRL